MEDGHGESLCQCHHLGELSSLILVVALVLVVPGFVATNLFAAGFKYCLWIWFCSSNVSAVIIPNGISDEIFFESWFPTWY